MGSEEHLVPSLPVIETHLKSCFVAPEQGECHLLISLRSPSLSVIHEAGTTAVSCDP